MSNNMNTDMSNNTRIPRELQEDKHSWRIKELPSQAELRRAPWELKDSWLDEEDIQQSPLLLLQCRRCRLEQLAFQPPEAKSLWLQNTHAKQHTTNLGCFTTHLSRLPAFPPGRRELRYNDTAICGFNWNWDAQHYARPLLGHALFHRLISTSQPFGSLPALIHINCADCLHPGT